MIQRPKTALECLDMVLAHDRELQRIYGALLDNVWVRALGAIPPLENVAMYLRWLRRGFAWALERLGKEAMPAGFRIAADPPPMAGWGPNFIAYIVEWDMVVMGMARVAQDALVCSWDELRAHDGLDFQVPAWLHTMLIPIEECFHRHQLRVLGRPLPAGPTCATSDDPLEAEAREFVANAARELLARKPAYAP